MNTQRYVLLGFVCLIVSCFQTNLVGAQQSGTPTPITIGESLRIVSKKLDETREIRVALPTSYARSSQRYPVIYATDGESLFLPTAGAAQFMATASELPQMPEAIVVGIPNTNRGRDMPIPQQYGRGGEENFLAFLADELAPFIDQRYRTQPLRVLVGHSQGGTFAHYAFVTRPTIFQWILPVDGPLFGPVHSLLEKTREMVVKDAKFRGRLVTIERQLGWMNEWPSLIESAPKGFYGARVEITDESHETMVYKGIYEGLKRLFHDYAPDVKDAKLEQLETRYKTLSEAYGYPVDVPLRVLLVSAGRNAAQRYGDEAVKLVQKAIAVYGESPSTKRLMASAEEAVKKGRPDPRVAEFLNAPFPGPETMAPFVGVWEGSVNVPGGTPMQNVLTLAIDNGKVNASAKVKGPSGNYFSSPVDFLIVIDNKNLQWGRKHSSGGIYVSTAKLIDADTLEGTEKLIGVDPPLGVKFAADAPPNTFTFKRRSASQKSSSNISGEQNKTAKLSSSISKQSAFLSPNVKPEEITIGAVAPDWTLKTVEEEAIALSALRGNVVVLDFWANWCGPCRKLMPQFDRLAREYQNKPVRFFTVSIWPGPEFNPRSFLKEHRLDSMFLIGDEAVASNYGIWGVPTYCVIDPAGTIAFFHTLLVVDPMALNNQLREAIEKALPKDQETQPFINS